MGIKDFLNQYRSNTLRKKTWDYQSSGFYFITINTKNRKHFFGKIERPNYHQQMVLSELGILANNFWYEIPLQFPNVKLGAHIVMPNHVHGILTINNPLNNKNESLPPKSEQIPTIPEFQPIKWPIRNKIPHYQSGSLGSIINQYKGKCTKECQKIDCSFGWQRGYYDCIINDATGIKYIEQYIRNNPNKW